MKGKQNNRGCLPPSQRRARLSLSPPASLRCVQGNASAGETKSSRLFRHVWIHFRLSCFPLRFSLVRDNLQSPPTPQSPAVTLRLGPNSRSDFSLSRWRCSVESSRARELEVGRKFTGGQLSFLTRSHPQHLLHILLLGLIPDTQEGAPSSASQRVPLLVQPLQFFFAVHSFR